MTVFGPDGSHHQDDLVLTEKDRPDFAFWRSSISDRIDSTYKPRVKWFSDRNVPFAAYHFVYQTEPHAGTTSSGRSADAQAQTIHASVQDKTIPIMLDWEKDSYVKNGKEIIISSASFDEVLAVKNSTEKLGYTVKWLYTGRWWWQFKGSPTLSGNGFDLVNADYGNQAVDGKYEIEQRYKDRGGDSGRGWTSYGGLANKIWQYGSRIHWGNLYMDMNAIRETLDLRQYFKIWKVPPPPLPVPVNPTGEEMVDFEDIKQVWVAPGPAEAADPKNIVWFNSILLKVGAVADVQRQNNLPVTGIYNQATALVYAKLLEDMKVAAGVK